MWTQTAAEMLAPMACHASLRVAFADATLKFWPRHRHLVLSYSCHCHCHLVCGEWRGGGKKTNKNSEKVDCVNFQLGPKAQQQSGREKQPTFPPVCEVQERVLVYTHTHTRTYIYIYKGHRHTHTHTSTCISYRSLSLSVYPSCLTFAFWPQLFRCVACCQWPQKACYTFCAKQISHALTHPQAEKHTHTHTQGQGGKAG